MAHEGIFETCAAFGELVDVGGLYDRITIATECAGRLIIRKEKDDIGPIIGTSCCRPVGPREQQQAGAEFYLSRYP